MNRKGAAGSVPKEQRSQPGTADLSGYQPVQVTETTTGVSPEKIRQDQMEALMSYAADQSRPIGKVAAFVLQLIESGQTEFTTSDISSIPGLSFRDTGSTVNALKKHKIIEFIIHMQ